MAASQGQQAVGVDGRWFLRLHRRAALRLREHLEEKGQRRPWSVDVPEVPVMSQLVLGPVRYILAGSVAALQRVVVIDAPEALPELGLGWLAERRSASEREASARAFELARTCPGDFAFHYLDDDYWPPDVRHPALEARSDRLGDLLAGLSVSVSSAADVARMLHEGIVPARWRLLRDGRVDGTSAATDLINGGASFAFCRLLPKRWLGRLTPEISDYNLVLRAECINDVSFVLNRDRFGNPSAIRSSLTDDALSEALRTGGLRDDHEVLFPAAVDATQVRGVLCRTEDAYARLRAHLPDVRIPVRVSDRYAL